jgi:hypothetical protein
MCIGCRYLIDGWWWHGLCWRERSQLIRWTESTSCFGKVLASFLPFIVLVYLWYLCLDYSEEKELNIVQLAGYCIMTQMLLCLTTSWVQLMYKLLGGSYTMPFLVLLWREKPDCFVPTTLRLLCSLFTIIYVCVFVSQNS